MYLFTNSGTSRSNSPQFSRLLICTAPQMIPDCKWSPDWKWSPNWTANDPRWGPQMIPPENEELNGVWFSWIFLTFYFIYVYIFFSQLNSYVDKHKGKTFSDDINYDLSIVFMTTSYYLLLTILPKKSKVVESNTISQQAWSITIIA